MDHRDKCRDTIAESIFLKWHDSALIKKKRVARLLGKTKLKLDTKGRTPNIMTQWGKPRLVDGVPVNYSMS